MSGDIGPLAGEFVGLVLSVLIVALIVSFFVLVVYTMSVVL